ncbi:hypothetical protein EB796_016242 [Bugula neritina]|uniref:Uncharacterized protein n=1 Tax=Bugula neritina TaxID=10212 RepID=A0A7J7JIX0_BUGNE|nr:hypothetical protein EB796_016242 [Bugula neritina]
MFGISLASLEKSRESTDTNLTPSPKSIPSPDFDFYIVPRSPSPPESDSVSTLRLGATRRLSSKVLPEAVEIPKTPTPPPLEPSPIRRRVRRYPSVRAMAKIVKTFRKKSSHPVPNKKELRSIVDPMDYLAKYCLIHPERLPVYERIFKEVVARQEPRFADVYCSLDSQQPPQIQQVNHPKGAHANLSEDQRQRIRNMATINGVSDTNNITAINTGEFHFSKLNFTLEALYDKYNALLDEYEALETIRDTRMAALAREKFPQILNPDYVVDNKAKKKKKKSGKNGSKSKKKPEVAHSKDVRATFVLTDAQVCERLNSREKELIERDEEVYRLKLRMDRLEAKIYSSENRMDELEAEKDEMQIWSQELYLTENIKSNQKPEFRRAQSALFNKFNPDVDEQMNIEEVEEALRAVNGHLLTDREMQFIYNVLNIPGRKVINLKTFGCIAALSEKVQQLHPDIRKLINKFSFEALEVKMEKCKELYELLYEGEADKPTGTVPMGSVNVELLAGGLSDEHLDFVTNKFNRTKKGYLEYMDYLTYIPLFVELHDRICSNPLATERVS